MQKNPQRYVDQIRITNFDMIYMRVTNRAMRKTMKRKTKQYIKDMLAATPESHAVHV